MNDASRMIDQTRSSEPRQPTTRTAVPNPRRRSRPASVNVFYGDKQALFDVDLDIPENAGDRASSAPRAAASRPSCAASTA